MLFVLSFCDDFVFDMACVSLFCCFELGRKKDAIK